MRIVGPATLAAYPGRIVNTHPSLLPSFPGAHAVRDALAHGAAVSGATVHLVDETLDGGPIVAQEAVAILPGDDEASLHERIQAVEHRLLPRVVGLLLAGAVDAPTGGTRRSTSPGPRRTCPSRAGRSSRSATRPAWSSWRPASWPIASSSSRPAAPPGPCARPACR